VQIPRALQASVVQGLRSSQLVVPAQMPPVQRSPAVQALPSLQVVPSATFEVTQPETGLHATVWHGLAVLHVSPVPEAQFPPWQVSAPSHTLPLLQLVPFGMLVTAEHTPAVHVLALWQASPAAQVATTAGAQVRAVLHVRGPVARLPTQLPGAPQDAPTAFSAQLPAPAPVAVHWPVKQLGLLAESAAHAVEQQIRSDPVPCTHAPLAQSVSTPHLAPLADTTPQVFRIELQAIPALQSVAAVAAVQLVRQVAPLQV
jgi:hypothetical protein